MKKNTKTHFWHGMTALALGLTVLGGGIYVATGMLEARINFMLGTTSSKVVNVEASEAENNLYFESDFKTPEELISYRENLNAEIVADGAVLLKNENESLPLKKGSRVTMFGIGGVSPVYSGAAGGGVIKTTDQIVPVTKVFEEKGFSVNPTVHDWYVSTGIPASCVVPVVSYDGTTSLKGPWENKSREYATRKAGVTEADASAAFSQWTQSYASYSDAAIVWLCRYEGEGADVPDDSLSLTAEENALIAEAKSHFSNVVVIVNGSAAIELDSLARDPKISSIIWVSELGTHGSYGLADILTGAVSPSGHLPDTFSASTKSSPAYQNSGAFFFANAQSAGLDYFGSTYLIQAEGIYLGYKYYETRYEDSVLNQGNAKSKVGTFASKGDWNYGEEVSYPFGFGLSYSSFEQTLENVEVDIHSKTIRAVVSVLNTGSVSAKDVVQIYAQSPYTNYDKENKIEKSAVQLLGFEKTKLLAPGESEKITISMDMKYLASYDRLNAKTYILDSGDYYFALGNGSHQAVNNILSAKGFSVSDGMDSEGNAKLVYKWTNDEFDAKSFAYGSTGVKITNQFEEADYNYWAKDTVTYLSRSDWSGTWPISYQGLSATEEMLPYLSSEQYTKGSSDTKDIVSGSTQTSYSLITLKGVDYNDPLWDELLNQVSAEELCALITDACEHTTPVKSVQYQGSKDKDGPIGYDATFNPDKTKPYHIDDSASDYVKKYNFASLCTEPTMAATFNKKLAEKRGELNGEDGLWSGFTVLWAPGANLHRTPYSGRNYEYFSEDSMLTNNMASIISKATQKKGAISAPKHFAGNDQETNRNGVATFYSEQAFREAQLRAFEGALSADEGGALSTMTSFSRIGVKQAAYSESLLTSVLRDEWGFKGYTITDFAFNNLMYPYASLTAGTDAFDNMISDFSAINAKALSQDAKLFNAARTAAHRILYVYANSNVMNGVSANSKVVTVIPWWKAVIIAFTICFAVLTLVSCVRLFFLMKNTEESSGANTIGFAISLCSVLLTVISLVSYFVLSRDGEKSPAIVYTLSVIAILLQLCVVFVQKVFPPLRKINSSSVLATFFTVFAFIQMMLGRIEWLGGLAAHNASLAPMHLSFTVTVILFVLTSIVSIVAAFFPQRSEE